MKKTFRLYLIYLLILAYALLNYFVIIKQFNLIFIELFIMIFAIIIWLISYFFYGFPKKYHINQKIAIKSIIMVLLLALVVAYILGTLMGFSHNIFTSNYLYAILVSILVSIGIVMFELVRSIVIDNSTYHKQPIIILTICYIIFNILMNIPVIRNGEDLFIFGCTVVIPIVAREIMAGYLNYHFGYKTSICYLIPISIYGYLLPFLPNLGNYINSIIFLFIPFLIYLLNIKTVKYNNKDNLNYDKKLKYVLLYPILVFLIIVVILVSGIFRYKLIAIGSNSMNPVFYRGDSVIYEKVKNINDVKVGDIIVFQKDNIIVTHRLIAIKKENGKIKYITKGDNNEVADSYNPQSQEIIGKVKLVIKYVGYPTIWLTEKN